MTAQDFARALWHAAVVLASFGEFFLVGRVVTKHSLATVTFLATIPTWLLLPAHPIATGVSLGDRSC